MTSVVYNLNTALKVMRSSSRRPLCACIHKREMLILTNQQREYWDIQAERARIMADREHVQLEGQVQANRGGVLPDQRITLHAQDVTLAHKAQTASSTHPVTVDGANWQSQSSGFQAHLATEQLEQTGRVHDRYQPAKP